MLNSHHGQYIDSVIIPWISALQGRFLAGQAYNQDDETGEATEEYRVRQTVASVIGKRRRVPEIPRVSALDKIVLARKFMQTLDDHVYHELAGYAEQRGVTIQGLIRAVIVPDWINSQAVRQRASTGSPPNNSAVAWERHRQTTSENNVSLRGTPVVQR